MKTNVNAPSQCPSCGKPMPAGALAGLCPACLLVQGAETEPGDASHPPRFVPPSIAEIARLFPQLEILKLLGAGGMGAVYQARQPALDRIVALKILPAKGASGANFEERFNREARALARLNHPNIVAVFEFGHTPPPAAPQKPDAILPPLPSLHFILMEFVDGANLRQLERAQRLAPREALQIIPQICDALQYAHDEGVVHRDIKPENVLVDRKGRVKIADFGLAKILGPDAESLRLTREGQVMGTPHYMAPEQVEHPLTVDHRADIFSLGVVLYEMLTGDLPLGNFSPPSRKVQVDVRFDEVVLRALENDPARRYQHASEVKSRMATIAESPAAATPGASAAPAPAEAGKRCFPWAGFGLVEEFRGRRTIHIKELLKAWACLFGLLTLALAPVSMILGHSYLGFIGLSGSYSLAFRAGAAAVTIGIVACWRLIRPGSAPLAAPDKAWWHRAWRRIFVVTFWIAAWTVFQFNWLQPWLKERFRAASGHQIAVRDATSGTLLAKLPNGTTLELLALAFGDADPKQWWRPDGAPIENVTFDIQGPGEMQGADRPRSKFAFRVTGWPSIMETAVHEFVPSAGVSAGGTVWQNGEKLAGAWPVRVSWAYATNRATLRFGLRYDPWRTIAAHHMKDPSRSFHQAAAGDPQWFSTFNHISDNGTNTLVTAVLNKEMKNWQMRIVAVDSDGIEHGFNRSNSTPVNETETWTCTFPGLTTDRIKEFQVQVRPVHWVEFRDVPLNADRPVPAAQRVTQLAVLDAGTGMLSAKLPGNSALELQAISSSNTALDTWWRPDGGRLPNGTFQVVGLADEATPTNAIRSDFAFRIIGNPPGIDSPVFDCEPAINPSFGGGVRENGRAITGGWALRALWGKDVRSATLRFGYGPGSWRTVLAYDPKDRKATPQPGAGDPDWMANIRDVSATNGGLQVTAELGPGSLAFLDGTDRYLTVSPGRHAWNWRLRVVVVDRAGTEHVHDSAESRPVPETEPWQSMLWQFQFPGLTTASTREVRIQVEPLYWVEFRNVPLYPHGSATPVVAPATFGPSLLVQLAELVDLDTGHTADFPPAPANSNPFADLAESILWAQEIGFDAVAGLGELELLGVKAAEISPTEWETMSPAEADARLAASGTMARALSPLNPGRGPAPAYAFRTREGGVGLIRFVQFRAGSSEITVQLRHVSPDKGTRKLTTASRDRRTGEWVAGLPGQAAVALVGLKAANASPDAWQRADRQPVTGFHATVTFPSMPVETGGRAYDLLFRVTGLPETSSPPLFECANSLRQATDGQVLLQGTNDAGLQALRVAWRETDQSASIRAGVPLADWHTIRSFEPMSRSFSKTSWGDDPKWEIEMHAAGVGTRGAQLTVVFGAKYPEWSLRVGAKRNQAADAFGTAEASVSNGPTSTITYVFPGLTLADVQSFFVQAQPLAWAEFPEVKFTPAP